MKSRKITGYVFPSKATNSKVSQRVQRAGEGGLFLGRLDQGLVGNAESTHVDRPKGKAPLVSNVGRYCKFLKEHIVKRPATSMFSRLRERFLSVGNNFFLTFVGCVPQLEA